MRALDYSIVLLSETSLEVRGANDIQIWVALKMYLQNRLKKYREVLNTEDSVVIFFDKSTAVDLKALERHLDEFSVDMYPMNQCAHHEITVHYSSKGSDLSNVAKMLETSEEQIIKWHSNQEYTISMYGFVPGFAYLTGLYERLNISRKAQVAKKVKAGSVAIANNYTGVYPFDMPGGWHVIGFTEERMFDIDSVSKQRFHVGDKVRFISGS